MQESLVLSVLSSLSVAAVTEEEWDEILDLARSVSQDKDTEEKRLKLLDNPNVAKVYTTSGDSALYILAGRGGEKTQLKILKRPDVSATQRNSTEKTPLHELAAQGTEKVMLEVLKHPDVSKVKDILGYTPLHHLASRGNEKIQTELLNHPDVSKVTNNYGDSPLSLLARKTSAIKPLVQKKLKEILNSSEDISELDMVRENIEDPNLREAVLKKINKIETGHETMPQGDPELEDIERAFKKVSESQVTEGTEIFTDPSGKYWGNSGAGGLFYAEDTGRYLFAHRSEDVNEPNTWGTWGGAIEEGESPEAALTREVREETGYTGSMKLKHVYTFKDGDFKFYNYIINIPKEFEPRHSWETQGHVWVKLDKPPKPLHYGAEGLVKHLKGNPVKADILKGGKADDMPDIYFDPEQLACLLAIKIANYPKTRI